MANEKKPQRKGRPKGAAAFTALAGFGTFFGVWGGLAVANRPTTAVNPDSVDGAVSAASANSLAEGLGDLPASNVLGRAEPSSTKVAAPAVTTAPRATATAASVEPTPVPQSVAPAPRPSNPAPVSTPVAVKPTYQPKPVPTSPPAPVPKKKPRPKTKTRPS